MKARAALVATGLLLAVFSGVSTWTASSATTEPIRIGDLMSYTGFAEFAANYRNGWQLALEEINAAGGVLGRKLEVLSRDDANDPSRAVRVAEELIHRDNVCCLIGTVLDHVGLAVSDVSRREHVPFIKPSGATTRHIWERGHPYAFRVDISTDLLARVFAQEASKLPAKRWAIISPNYEFGHAMVADFKRYMKALRPDVEWVVEQWPALGKMDPAATTRAIANAKPDAIFSALNVDFPAFIRAGKAIGLFDGRVVFSPYLGDGSAIGPVAAEVPAGWLVHGYNPLMVHTPAHDRFLAAYRAKFHEDPNAALLGYITLKAAAAAIEKARSTDRDAITRALTGLKLETPVGPLTFRPQDNQSTMGIWLGKTAITNGKASMSDGVVYYPGNQFMPTDEEVKKLRPASKN